MFMEDLPQSGDKVRTQELSMSISRKIFTADEEPPPVYMYMI